MSSHEPILVSEVVTETKKAVLVRIAQDEYWIPKSVIHEDDEYVVGGGPAEINVATWWAEKEGLL